MAQLDKLAGKIAANPGNSDSHRKLLALRPALDRLLALPAAFEPPPPALQEATGQPSATYLETINALPATARQAGTAWLQAIVDKVQQHWETCNHE